MIILAVSFSKIAVGILFVSLSILVLVIAYRKLLAYLGKGKVKNEMYCILYSIEKNPAHGNLEFYFSCEEEKEVTFEILNEKFEVVEILASKLFTNGSHILHFDSNKLKNGTYYYQLKTSNQKTYKKLEIQN